MKLKNLTKRYLALALSAIVLMTATSLNILLTGAIGNGEPEVFSAQFKPYSDSLGDSFLTTWSHEKTYQSNINFTDMFANGWSSYTERKYSGNYPFRTDKNGEISSRIVGLTPIDSFARTPELKNFELTFDYRVPHKTAERCGAVWVGFRQKEAGHFTDFNKNQSFARITNTGITIASGSNVSSALHGDGTEDISMSAENTAWLAANGSLVTVKVKAVGNTCTVGVYKTSGEELLTYTEELDSAALENGYLTLGIADRQIHMISLTIKRLDDSGNVIDFTDNTLLPEAVRAVEVYKTAEIGTEFESLGLPATVSVIDEYEKAHQCAVEWKQDGYIPNQIGKYTVYGNITAGTTVNNTSGISATAVINVVRDINSQKFETDFSNYDDSYSDNFGFFWNHEKNYNKNLKATDCFKNLANNFAERKQSSYDTGLAGEYFSRAASMSPKVNGDLTTVKNFELTLDLRTPWNYSSSSGAVWIGFHQQEAGHFFTGYKQFGKEQGFVRVTSTGITVSSGNNCGAGDVNKEDISIANNSDALKTADGRFSIYVKVMGNTCYVRVYETVTGNTIGEYSEYLDGYTPATGYISLGVGDAVYAFDKLVITRLDSDGAAVDFSEIDKYNVAAVNPVSRTAELGTAFESIGLPAKVEVIDSAGIKHECEVTWNSGEYDKTVSGMQTVTGTLKLPDFLLNPDNITAAADIYLSFPESIERFQTDFSNYDDSYGNLFNYYWNHEGTYIKGMSPTASFKNLANNFAERTNKYEGYALAGEYFSRTASMAVKTQKGATADLKNFEATLKVRISHNVNGPYGAIWVGFHQSEPGKLFEGYARLNTKQSFVRLTNTGLTIAGGDEVCTSGKRDEVEKEDITFNSSALKTADSRITLIVKVYNGKCTVSVYDSKSNERIAQYSEKLPASAPESGALAIGVGDAIYGFDSLTVVRLDDNGAPLDFSEQEIKKAVKAEDTYISVESGTAFENLNLPKQVVTYDEKGLQHICGVVWSSVGYNGSRRGTYDIYGTIQAPEGINAGSLRALARVTVKQSSSVEVFKTDFTGYGSSYNDIFAFAWNHETRYELGLDATDAFNNLANNFAERKKSTYDAGLAGEYFSRTASMSPKTSSGTMANLRNFEMTLNLRVAFNNSKKYGAVFVGFRQNEPGHYFTGYKCFNTEQGMVRLTNTGLTVYSGSDVPTKNTPDVYDEDVEIKSDILKKADNRVTLYVKVLGNVCYVSVTNTKTHELIAEHTENINSNTPYSGALSIGVGDAIYGFDSLEVVRLDNSDNVINFSDQEPQEIVSVTKVALTAEKGSSFDKLSLPTAVLVKDAGGMSHPCGVEWSQQGFDTSKRGLITLHGRIILPEGLRNTAGIRARADVTVIASADFDTFKTDFTKYGDSYSELFNFYWNHETRYETGLRATECFNNLANNFAERKKSEYDAGLAGEYFSRTGSMSPKQSDGTQARLKNFDLTLNIRVASDNKKPYGGILVGFHQKEAGHYFTGYASYNTEQGFVRLTNTGLTVASGANIRQLKGLDRVNTEDVKVNDPVLRTADGRVTLNVTVINDICRVTVKNTKTGDVIASYSEKLDSSVLATGYLSVGVMDSRYSFDSMNIVKLDDNGNDIPFSTALPYEIVEIQDSYSVVGLGTAFAKADLPTSVLATDDIGVKHRLNVNWSSAGYDKNSLGVNKISGKPVLPKGYLNTNNISAKATVTVIQNSYSFSDSYFNDFETTDLKTALKGFKSYYADKTIDNVLLSERPESELYALKNGRLVRTEAEGKMDMVSSIAMLTYTQKTYNNFQLDVDFRQGGNSWGWAMVGFGSKEPNAYFNNTENGGTLAYTEQQGYTNLLGKIPNVANNHVRATENPVPGYSDTWSTQMHHMTLIVYRFKVTMIIDGNVMLEQKLATTYRGGYISLLSNRNFAIFDNLSIRSINTPTPVAVGVNDYNTLVKYGTDVNAIKFPETVKVVADDEMEYSCKVTWDLKADYDSEKTGLYVFTGTLQPSKEFNNPSGIKALANIYVDENAENINQNINIDKKNTGAKKTPVLKTVLITAVPAAAILALAVFGLIVLYKKIRTKKS